MENFFVPYTGKKPALVCINGHRLVILAHEKDTLEEDLDLLGADRVKKVKLDGTEDEQERLFGTLLRESASAMSLRTSKASCLGCSSPSYPLNFSALAAHHNLGL